MRDLAAKLVKSGTSGGAVVNQLRALMEAPTAPRDERWRERCAGDPAPGRQCGREVRRGRDAEDAPPPADRAAEPCTIDETLAVFDQWLLLPDPTPIYAVLGTVAANLLPGDPVWLGLIAPPSCAKTEILNSISGLPNVVQAATLTVGRTAVGRAEEAARQAAPRAACCARSATSESSR